MNNKRRGRGNAPEHGCKHDINRTVLSTIGYQIMVTDARGV